MSKEKISYGVAIVGCGTVGGATALLLTRDRKVLDDRFSGRIDLRHIVDVDFTHARQLGLDESLFTENLDTVLSDDNVHVIAELVGGIDFARQVVERALRAGKNVVTANKFLLAEHGPELYALARENGVCIAFEASCAGGVPIIRALCDGLGANRIDAMYGIVNGTCNYILTAMTDKNQSYSDALEQAQRDGLAESDPTLDVSGGDSAHKLVIMASLAFGRRVKLSDIPAQGIDTLELCDIDYGSQLGYVVKLLAIAQRQEDGFSLRVRPVFISREHPLAWVSGPFNAVSVYGHATGHTMYYGRGAGAMPTGSAVVSDIASLAVGSAAAGFDNMRFMPDLTDQAVQLPIEKVHSRYYLRLTCMDLPGVFAQVAAVLGKHEISISSLLQHEPSDTAKGIPVVITTHRITEGAVCEAVKEIDALDCIIAPSVRMGIVDEHPEELAEGTS